MLATHEHAQDVLAAAISFAEAGQAVALAMVTATEGGGVRAPGALMAIAGDGQVAGYLSGGCIDADVRLQAQRALDTGTVAQLRYGAGSAFGDIKLPCGGAIDVLVTPRVSIDAVLALHDRLASRQAASMAIAADGQAIVGLPRLPGELFRADYRPRLAVRIAGRGADCLALARIATAAQVDVSLALPDREDAASARAAGLTRVQALSVPTALPAIEDDSATGFVLMFHDSDWEVPLLQQALAGPAFYVGAVGSAQTHRRRCQALADAGCPAGEIARIHGPIGLIPSMRSASMLGVSVLAELIAAYTQVEVAHV